MHTAWGENPGKGGKKIALQGGDGTEAHLPNPPPSPSLVAMPGGGFGLGLPYLLCPGGGGGVRPQHTWLKMIPTSRYHFDYTYAGEIFSVKKFFRAKICVPAPLVATSVLTQNKGPGTEAHFWWTPRGTTARHGRSVGAPSLLWTPRRQSSHPVVVVSLPMCTCPLPYSAR